MEDSTEEHVGKDGARTSRLALAHAYWLTGMTVVERARLESRVPFSGSAPGESLHSVMQFVVANLLDYHVSDEHVLSATPKAAADARAGMAKSFSATWDEAFVDPGTRTVGEAAFNSSSGYNDHDLEGIRELAVGETWRGDEWGSSHTVTRLPDIELAAANRAGNAPDSEISETIADASAARPRG